MKEPKDNLNKPTGKANPKKRPAGPPKPKGGFGQLGASASMPGGNLGGGPLNSPYNMQGMP